MAAGLAVCEAAVEGPRPMRPATRTERALPVAAQAPPTRRAETSGLAIHASGALLRELGGWLVRRCVAADRFVFDERFRLESQASSRPTNDSTGAGRH